MHKATKERLNALVHTLSLAVSLRVIGRTETQLGTSRLEEQLPQLASKYPVPVRNNDPRHAVKTINLIHEQLGHRGSCERML